MTKQARLYQEEHNQELTISLREQQEIIMHVEKRLEKRVEQQTPPMEVIPTGTTDSSLFPSPRRSTQARPIVRIVSFCAAVLVVGVLIGGSAMLLAQHTQSTHSLARQTATPDLAGPIGTSVEVNVQWDGLAMSMMVTPGPYFLGELLAVDLSLTNQTHPTLTLAGGISPSPCGSSLYSTQTGGTSPYYIPYTMPVSLIYFCPIIPGKGPVLAPGQNFTTHSYILLTSSGDVTLTGEVSFYLPETTSLSGPGPLDGHLPTLLIHVASQVPADRLLVLQQEGSNVVIHTPPGVHLLNQTYIICQDSQNHAKASGTGHTLWSPLSTNVLSRPNCTGTNLTFALWKYAVGAEGYEVMQGQQGQYSGPNFP